jgi:hypothetical protein
VRDGGSHADGGCDPAQVVERLATVLTAATTTSQPRPSLHVAEKTVSLPMNTDVGEVPSRQTTSASAIQEWRRPSPV